MDELLEHMRNRAVDALRSATQEDREDTYVVSFFVYDAEDDPRHPTLTVGINTESQVREALDEASDEEEARWNYAFWRHDALTVIGGESDKEGAALIEASFRKLGLWYEDDEVPDNEDERDAELSRRFVEACVATATHLHESGVLVEAFGRVVPVIVHELEYYEAIAEQNLRANPPELVQEFVAFATG